MDRNMRFIKIEIILPVTHWRRLLKGIMEFQTLRDSYYDSLHEILQNIFRQIRRGLR